MAIKATQPVKTGEEGLDRQEILTSMSTPLNRQYVATHSTPTDNLQNQSVFKKTAVNPVTANIFVIFNQQYRGN